MARWQALSSAVTRVQHRVDGRVEEAGVSPAWFTVLHLLLNAEGHRRPMSALAREVSMTSGGFTKLADRMARDGLIDRRGSSDDRRVVNATLTDSGLALARRAARAYHEALREYLLGVVDAADLDVVATKLQGLNDAYGAVTDDVPDIVAGEHDPHGPDRRQR